MLWIVFGFLLGFAVACIAGLIWLIRNFPTWS
jgi:uncharacterized protein involved in exopolysaccharide biosynthesis